MDEIDRVYAYWFGDAPARDAATADAKMRRWYVGGPSMDLEVREKFGPLVEQEDERDATRGTRKRRSSP
jgi:hypothetical protein